MSTLFHYKAIAADTNPVYRFGLRTLLKNIQGIEEVHEASDGKDLMQKLKTTSYDVVLIDFQNQQMNAQQITKFVCRQFPNTKVIALILDPLFLKLEQMLDAGVKGILMKNCDMNEIVEAIRAVCSGQHYYSQNILDLISLRSINKGKLKKGTVFEQNTLAIMYLMYHEKTSKEIAGILRLSARTIEDYREKILRDTNSVNMIGIIKFVVENGIHQNEYLQSRFEKHTKVKNFKLIDFIR